MTAPQPPIGKDEKAVGFKGRHIIFYRRDGRPYWDASYAPTAAQARDDFVTMAHELGWAVRIERIEVRT